MTREHEEWCRAELKAKMAEAKQLRAEVEQLTALLQEAVSDPRRNVLGDDWWKRAKAALEQKP
jgi:hypothetical protein